MEIDLIPFGKENKISKHDLMRLAKIQDKKELNSEIARLRKDYIIMEDTTNCYWRCNDRKEMQEFIKKYQCKSYRNSKMIMLAYKELEAMPM